MFRKLFTIPFYNLAKIKGNIIKPNQIQPLKIANFFNLPIKVPPSNTISQQHSPQLIKTYLKYIGTNLSITTISPINFLKSNKQLRLLQFTKQCIAKNYKTKTQQCQRIINNFYNFCVDTFIYIHRNHTDSIHKNMSNMQQSYSQLFITINQFFILVTPQPYAYIKYCEVLTYQFFSKLNTPPHYFVPNYRIALDYLVQIPQDKMTLMNLGNILKTMNIVNVKKYYHEKSQYVVKHFWEIIHKNEQWYKNMKTFQIFLDRFSRLGCYNQKMVNIYVEILSKHHKIIKISTKTTLLNTLLNVFKINNDNYKEYDTLLTNLTKNIYPDQLLEFYKKTIHYMSIARVWNQQYWLVFFRLLDQNGIEWYGSGNGKGRTGEDSNQHTQFYYLFIINSIIKIQADNVPIKIRNSSSSLAKLINSRPNFGAQQMIVKFYQKGNRNQSVSCQNQIANALRLINIGSVRTQHIIDIFCVDIVINNQFIVEINGGTHYLFNMDLDLSKNYRNLTQQNLKTKFRSYYLMKLGYKVIDIQLEEYNQGSFQIIKRIGEIIVRDKGTKEPKSYSLP